MSTLTFTSSEINRLLKAPKFPFIQPSHYPPTLALSSSFCSKSELNQSPTNAQHSKYEHKDKNSSDKALISTRACSEEFEDEFICDRSLSILELLQLNKKQV